MVELLTAAQMRAIEAAAIARGAVTGLELMERAGRGVVEAIFAEWPELAPGTGALPWPEAALGATPGALPRTPGYLDQDERAKRAVVLCGPGNNGGDGFVVARLLRGWGWEVKVFLYGEPGRMPPDARVNYERWVAIGEVVSGGDPEIEGAGVDLYVDAIFGTGLSRLVSDREIMALHRISAECEETGRGRRPHLVAVDVPSGLDADSGRPIQRSVVCDLTVTFHRAKIGHYLEGGATLCGKVRVVDIGLGQGEGGTKVTLGLDRSDLAARLAKRAWQANRAQHKYAHGHALILSGQPGHGGAARLAARGALRIGAGVVTLGAPGEAMAENAARLEAVMLREVSGAEDLAVLLSDKRINALCLGPGLGTGEALVPLVHAALRLHLPATGQPLSDTSQEQVAEWYRRYGHRPSAVLDADALTLLSRDEALFGALHDRCVLTPHASEFARLFPDLAEKLNAPATKGPAYSKVDATREAAQRAGCVVLFKGADTVIAAPDGRGAVNSAQYDRAAPWLATAGSGDVLAGFITGLLARGFPAFDAACTGAWLHVDCARSFGPGLIAEDLPEELPKVFRALGL